jgi:hypothetical protein
VSRIDYAPDSISYQTYDLSSEELLRLKVKPKIILAGNKEIPANNQQNTEGWKWTPMDKGGVLRIKHQNSNKVTIHL